MRKSRKMLAAVAMSMSMVLSACSAPKDNGAPAAEGESMEVVTSEQEEVTLKYSTTSTPGTVFVQAFQRMADEVEEKTSGKVKVVVYDSSQLGNESDVTTNVLDGSIDMCNSGSRLRICLKATSILQGLWEVIWRRNCLRRRRRLWAPLYVERRLWEPGMS